MATSFFLFIARLLLASYFLFASYQAMRNWRIKVAHMKQAKVPVPTLSLLLGLLFKVFASILLIIGEFVQFAAVILMALMIIDTVACQRFWKKSDQDKSSSIQQFMTNLALIGAMILLLILL